MQSDYKQNERFESSVNSEGIETLAETLWQDS